MAVVAAVDHSYFEKGIEYMYSARRYDWFFDYSLSWKVKKCVWLTDLASPATVGGFKNIQARLDFGGEV